MKSFQPLSLAAILLVCSAVSITARGSEAIPSVGEFTLRSHLGREWSLSDFSDKRLIAVAFLGTECPLAKLYGPRLAKLHETYAQRGVAFVGINANTQDSMTELAAYAERYEIPFPLLKDVGNRVADQFQAERTPEVFLLDQQRQIRYHGRIDDQYGVGFSRDQAERHDLEVAITELLDGKEVSVPKTEAVGCHIGRVQQVEPVGDITYSNQISRLFNKRCVECHREGEIAPFTLTSYDDILGWEDTILEVIDDNRMPPWYANPEHGTFRNDARLTPQEKDLVAQWVENGMPEGDPSQLPPPPKFTEGWRIPEPDQVFTMRAEPFDVQAEGIIDYQHFVVDPVWQEDKYISAAEARPGNKSVVHHILVYILPPGRGRRGPGLDSVLVGYAPGSMPVQLDPGVALKVKAGSKLLFQMHYTPNGYPQQDLSYAGVKFVDQAAVNQLIKGRIAINTRFRIPPHENSYQVTADYRSPREEILVSMTPHMHLRGKSFTYEATYPDGQKEILLDVPKYDFNWQLKYVLEDPKLLPRGTTIRCTATYDNSSDNLVNPDPSRTVSWGEQSWEEMMIGFIDVIPSVQKNTALRSTPSIDPSGNWAWEGRMPGKISLSLQDETLTGTMKIRGRDVDIEDAVIKGDQLTFAVVSPEMPGVTLDFDAQVTQDAIKGKVNFNISALGQSRSFPWTAERAE